MVTKAERPTELKLARGLILPDELVNVLQCAAEGASFTFIKFHWLDGHEAVCVDVSNLSPIEDAAGLRSVICDFRYPDGSSLSLNIFGYGLSTAEARGQTARQRQTRVAQLWAVLPGRGRPASVWSWWMWNVSASFFAGSVCALFTGIIYEHTTMGWFARGSAVLFTACLFLYVRKLTGVRWKPRLIVLHRRESRVSEVWTVVGGVAGLLGVIVAIGAWLYPRH